MAAMKAHQLAVVMADMMAMLSVERMVGVLVGCLAVMMGATRVSKMVEYWALKSAEKLADLLAALTVDWMGN